MAMQRLRLSGTATEMVELPVPVRRLNPGAVLEAEDLHMARVRAGLARGELVREAAQAVGMTLRRQLVPGQPVPLADLTRTPTVVKGAPVVMELRAGGLALAAPGIALEPGALGERIRVLNPSSRAVVEAEVTGPERVRVMPGSAPVALPPGRTAQLVPARRAWQ
jgi:flagella basal body P-ring formation protein FlgA